MDWQPYTLPNLEEPNIPLHDLVEWLGDMPGHPQQLTPHHTASLSNYEVESDGVCFYIWSNNEESGLYGSDGNRIEFATEQEALDYIATHLEDPMSHTSAEEMCPHCNEVHAEGEKCPQLYGGDFTMPPPPNAM